MRAKMNTKKILVSLCTIAIALFLVATVSATCGEVPQCNSTSPDCECCGTPSTDQPEPPIAGCITIELDGMNILNSPSVIAGETVDVKITFTAVATGSDVRIKAELEGDKESVDALSSAFDVEAGHTYT